MKTTTVQAKTKQSSHSSAGSNGAAAPPPSYGIDFLDHRQPKRTGLPDQLKVNVENLSCMSMDNVRVHYNSSKPAQLQALAYTQGTDIHVGIGQEKHLAHEAWHVVQQAQGRVKPTLQMKGVPVNGENGLEHEADVMGEKAMCKGSAAATVRRAPDRAAQNKIYRQLHTCGYDSSFINKAATLSNHNIGGPSAHVSGAVQRRRVMLSYSNSSGQIDSGMALESSNLSWDRLEELLDDDSLSVDSKQELMRAIDAGEVAGGYPGAYEYACAHLTFFQKNLPQQFGQENQFTWIRQITGGGTGTLTGKRDASGIKTSMSEEEYTTTAKLTQSFHDTAARLNQEVPRAYFLTLYRGFTIPESKSDDAIEELVTKIQGFSDVLPSSASWQREQAIAMSRPGEHESAVLVYMGIPSSHPIVIMSYPDNLNSNKDRAPPLDIGQAEVLVAASTYENVEVFRTEALLNGRIRYHVSVTMAARDHKEVMAGIENAREQAKSRRKPKLKTVDIDEAKLAGTFGENVAGQIKSSKSTGTTYTTLFGKRLQLDIADSDFGYTFSEHGEADISGIAPIPAASISSLAAAAPSLKRDEKSPAVVDASKFSTGNFLNPAASSSSSAAAAAAAAAAAEKMKKK